MYISQILAKRIVESSTFTIYVLILSGSNRAALKISTTRSSSRPTQSFYHHSQLCQFLFESGQYRLTRIAVQSTFALFACSSCSRRSTFKICQSPSCPAILYIPFHCQWLSLSIPIGKKELLNQVYSPSTSAFQTAGIALPSKPLYHPVT